MHQPATGWTLHDPRIPIDPAELPAWHALSESLPTVQCGKECRDWLCDVCALKITAAIPTTDFSGNWTVFSLAAAWAMTEALTTLGTRDLKVRWPRDIVRGACKIAETSVVRATQDTSLVVIELNMTRRGLSRPPLPLESVPPFPASTPGTPSHSIDEIVALILISIRTVHEALLCEGFTAIAALLNLRRLRTCRAELVIQGLRAPIPGRITRVDEQGRVYLTTDSGELRVFSPEEISAVKDAG